MTPFPQGEEQGLSLAAWRAYGRKPRCDSTTGIKGVSLYKSSSSRLKYRVQVVLPFLPRFQTYFTNTPQGFLMAKELAKDLIKLCPERYGKSSA